MAAHRGIGNRLLDGQQIKIMSLIDQGRTQQATAMIESSIPTEPWENTVAAILRIYCRPKTQQSRGRPHSSGPPSRRPSTRPARHDRTPQRARDRPSWVSSARDDA
jgi:hypothetical protein